MMLLELIEKGADTDLIRELLAFGTERLMAAEVDQLTGAATACAARTGSTTVDTMMLACAEHGSRHG